MKKKLYNVISSASVLMLLSQSIYSYGSNQLHYAISDALSLGDAVLLGTSFPVGGSCIAPTNWKVDGVESNLFMARGKDVSKIADSLNVDFSSKTGWGALSTSEAAKYVKEIAEDNYSISFTIHSSIAANGKLKTDDLYGEEALSVGAKKALHSSQDAFIRKCGDGFVKSAKVGAVLNATIKINFKDQQSKEEFEGKIDANLGDLNKASASIKRVLQSFSSTANVELMAYQSGGQPANLADVFGTESRHPMINCSVSNIDQCLKALDDVLDYAQARGKWTETGFKKQIKFVNGEIQADSVNVLGIRQAEMISYFAAFGVGEEPDEVSDDIRDARYELNMLYSEFSNNSAFLKGVTSSNLFNRLTTDAQAYLKKVEAEQNFNLSLFQSERAITCFYPKKESACPGIIEKIRAKTIRSDLVRAELLRQAYYFNVNYNWPLIAVQKDGAFDYYTTSLYRAGTILHNFAIIPSSDYRYVSLRGGYSTYDNGKQTRYYMDYYGAAAFVWRSFGAGAARYNSIVPWQTCVAGRCYKADYSVEVMPF